MIYSVVVHILYSYSAHCTPLDTRLNCFCVWKGLDCCLGPDSQGRISLKFDSNVFAAGVEDIAVGVEDIALISEGFVM